MQDEMLAHVAVIKSEAAALEANILTLVDNTPTEPEPTPEPETPPEPTPDPDPIPDPTPEPEPPSTQAAEAAMSMTVYDGLLSADEQLLLNRLERSVSYLPNGTHADLNLDGLSRSGRLNDISRHLYLGMVPVFAALRKTRARSLLERVYQVSENLKATLGMQSGFRGWPMYDPGTPWHGGVTVMEELKAHALIAQIAYAFRLNGHVDPKYNAAANFWQTYLTVDFVGRSKKLSGRAQLPFLQKNLTHAYAPSAALSHYMWMLTGDVDWLNERDRQVEVLHKELILVGDRYQWSHWINSLRSTAVFPIQHVNYSGEAITAFADLGFEGVFDETVMKRFANTVTFMLDGGRPKFLKNANGVAGVYYSPLLGKNVQMNEPDYPREGEYAMRRRGYSLMAYWDETGEIEGVCEDVDNLAAIQPIVGRLLAA